MPEIVNIAAYKFATLADLPPLRGELIRLARAKGVRGTILLSPEGVNLFLAGGRDDVDSVLYRLRRVPGLANLEAKESLSDDQPFNRMLVKIKREIIAFGVPGIAPAKRTAKRMTAAELKRWLDEEKPVTLLDTRNDFEIRIGTFKNALPIGVEHFRDFPAAAGRLPEGLKHTPVVTFCTGGIRCEKAAAYLEREGFADVYQLDGGILKYFETVGGAHYDGDCFVFDKRVAVDPRLRPSGAAQCYACRAILSAAEQTSPTYVEGESCPRCAAGPVVGGNVR